MSSRSIILFNVIFLLALGLRLWDLDLKPMHHDEGVNGWFVLNLYERGVYRYDPADYHGPFLYYATLPAFRILGADDRSLRLMPALFGALTLLPLLALRRRLGETGVLFAALLLALSPSHLFFARYAIHETFLVAFTLLLYVFGVRWLGEGRKKEVAGVLVSIAFLVTIKETWVLTVGAMGLALLLCFPGKVAGTLLRPAARPVLPRGLARGLEAHGLYRLRNLFPLPWALAGFAGSLLVLVLFYTSFFRSLAGLTGPIDTFRFYLETGLAGVGHEKPFLYYMGVLLRSEPHLLAVGLLGAVAAFGWRSRAAIYLFLWFLILAVMYSLIPYKTPWLVLNLTLPLALLGGWFLGRLWNRLARRRGRLALAAGTAVLFVTQASASIALNFVRFDDESRDQVYVHTRREVFDLLGRLEAIAASWPAGRSTSIEITSPEYWPLTWYLRDFDRVAYHGHPVAHPQAEIIIASRRDEARTTASQTGGYYRESLDLRPGAPLVVYYRSDLWEHVFGRGGPAVPAGGSGFDSARLEPGVRMRVYSGREPLGRPLVTSIEERIGFRWEDAECKLYQAPFSAVFDGLLHVEREGRYLFSVGSDDGSVLYLDGRKVVENGGEHGLRRSSGSAMLGAGYHAIHLRYFDAGRAAILEVTWRPPGEEPQALPASALLHRPD